METKEFEGASKTFRKVLRRYVLIHGEEYAELQDEYEEIVQLIEESEGMNNSE